MITKHPAISLVMAKRERPYLKIACHPSQKQRAFTGMTKQAVEKEGTVADLVPQIEQLQDVTIADTTDNRQDPQPATDMIMTETGEILADIRLATEEQNVLNNIEIEDHHPTQHLQKQPPQANLKRVVSTNMVVKDHHLQQNLQKRPPQANVYRAVSNNMVLKDHHLRQPPQTNLVSSNNDVAVHHHHQRHHHQQEQQLDQEQLDQEQEESSKGK